VDAQLQQVRQEKQSLQDQLANVNLELDRTKKAVREAEADKDELQARLRRAEKPTDDTFNVDSEKRELRRTKLKLEKDLDRIKADRDSLSQANEALEQEINAEIERGTAEEHRLQLEIDLLRNRQAPSASPPPSHSKELAQLRKDLVDARSQLQDARNHSYALERASGKRKSVLSLNGGQG
jgi:chromosome segregation ATPase